MSERIVICAGRALLRLRHPSSTARRAALFGSVLANTAGAPLLVLYYTFDIVLYYIFDIDHYYLLLLPFISRSTTPSASPLRLPSFIAN